MNRVFITDFSESRNQSGFIRVQEREFWRVSAEYWRIVANSSSALQFTDTFTDSGPSSPHNSLPHMRLEMAPKVGLEPTTTRLTAACSTIELLWMPHGMFNLQTLHD